LKLYKQDLFIIFIDACYFQGIVKQALGVLKALAGNDEVKIAIVKENGLLLVLAAMTQHQGTYIVV